MRYGDGKRRKNIAPIYREMLEKAEHLAAPRVLKDEFARSEVSSLEMWLPSRTTAVVLAVCTLGSAIEVREQELFPDDPHKSVVLNEISATQITAFARAIHTHLRQEAADRGLKAGPPYRPGLGRWPLETQRLVFERLPTHQIGVTLDEHLMMRPIKSISLIIPLLDQN